MSAQYRGRDESGTEYLLTIWDESAAELATRPLTAGTWGPPVPLVATGSGPEQLLICEAGTCTKPAQPEHSPCCSSSFHGKSFCCEHYCNSHFVEAHRCSPESHAAVLA